MRNKKTNIVVFDLDETLGHFVQLGIFCDVLEEYYKRKLSSNEFYEVMDIFPEFIRPNILKILAYLKIKKQKGECNKVIIYTNNQGPKEWAQKIQKYFEKKINYKLFDQIIAAYKINGVINEQTRTTYDKTSRDLLNSANLPDHAEICFLDDLYHPLMDNDNTYYIHVDPYTHNIPFNVMAERYYNSKKRKFKQIDQLDQTNFINFIVKQSNKYNFPIKNKSLLAMNNDKRTDKEIFYHLRNFFKINKKRQTRRSKQKNNITKKKS